MILFFFTSIHSGSETIKVSKALEGNIRENEIKNTSWRVVKIIIGTTKLSNKWMGINSK